METDIRYSEPSSRTFERETTTNAEQWSNWTTNQICSAIEDERERTLDLLTELLVRIQKDVIPEVVSTLPALRGPAGPRSAGSVSTTSGITSFWIRTSSSVSSSKVRSRSSSIALQIWLVVQFDHCSALVAVSRSKAREDGSLHPMLVSMTEASDAHATHTTTGSRSNNQPSVGASFFLFLEWLVATPLARGCWAH